MDDECCVRPRTHSKFSSFLAKNGKSHSDMAAHTCYLKAQEADAGVEGQPVLRSKFQDSLGYIRAYLKIKI